MLQTWKSGNIDQAVSSFDDCDGLWQNAVKVDKNYNSTAGCSIWHEDRSQTTWLSC